MAASARVVIIQSPYQNAFFSELATVIADEITQMGRRVAVVSEPHTFAPQGDDVFVLLPPHEWVAIEGDAWLQDEALASRTIGIGAEQPHSAFFAKNAAIGARLGCVFDFSAHAVEAFADAGISARHLPFGYTRTWDRFRLEQNSGGPDVVFLGNFKARRLDQLASMAEHLGRHHSHLVIADNTAPNIDSSRWFVAGDQKRDLLASSTVMLNIHQSDEAYFEWLRFTESALCGTVFLTEPAEKCEPYVAGHDFVEVPLSKMGDELDELLRDPMRLNTIRQQAYESVRSRPFARGIASLLEVADELISGQRPSALPARRRSAPLPHAKKPGNNVSVQPRRGGFETEQSPWWRRRRQHSAPVVAPQEGAIQLFVVGSAPVLNAPDDVEIQYVSSVEEACDRAGASLHSLVGVIPHGARLGKGGFERLVATGRASGAAIGMTVVRAPDGTRTLTALWPPSPDDLSSAGLWLAKPSLIRSIDATTLGVRLSNGHAWGHVPAPVADFTQL